MHLSWRNAGDYLHVAREGALYDEAWVALQGTLNQWRDVDESWVVEGRIPWSDFTPTGGRPAVSDMWKFALCRYDYIVDSEGPEPSTIILLGAHAPDCHRFEAYASLKFIGSKSPVRQVADSIK